MEKTSILKILDSWNFWNHDLDTGIRRDYYVNNILRFIDDPQILIVIETGIRRVGKSFIAKQIARALMEKNLHKTQVLIINLEDERLIERNYETILEMYEAYKTKINPDQKAIIILDEAQEIDGWERFVRGITEKGEAKFLITGSSSKLLDSEYSTLLSGRQVVVYIHPLDLLEFMTFTKGKGSLMHILKDGGFPAVTLSENKNEIVSSYFNTIILKDVIQRYRVRKQDELIRLAKFYVTSVGSRITFNSVAKFLGLPVKTAYNLSKYLENAYLIFFVERFSFSSKSQNNSPRKVYSIDNSFPSLLGLNHVEILGRLLENLIASTLYRISRKVTDFRFSYWHENGKEVDFVVKHKMKYKAFQVAYSVREAKMRNKEISALLDCAAHLNLDSCQIITMDYADEEIVNGITITYVPASDWIENTLNIYNVGSV